MPNVVDQSAVEPTADLSNIGGYLYNKWLALRVQGFTDLSNFKNNNKKITYV